MKFKYLFIGTALSVMPDLTLAQCVATQDCATLGYTESSCAGGSGVKCPFGNKWACFKSEDEIKEEIKKEFCSEYGFTLSCSGTGYSGGASQPCGEKYNYCTCADGFTWNVSLQKCEYDYKTNCIIGALYYSDGTCSQEKFSSKTLLGIVIYEKSNSENGWVIALQPAATAIAWDSGSYYFTQVTNKAVSASCINTQNLVALGSRFAAATAANNYKPTGTPSGKSWCLPSYDLINNINNSVNFAKINSGISTGGGVALGNISGGYERMWSSSEFGYNGAWTFDAYSNGLFGIGSNHLKSYNNSYFSVRPVMEF